MLGTHISLGFAVKIARRFLPCQTSGPRSGSNRLFEHVTQAVSYCSVKFSGRYGHGMR